MLIANGIEGRVDAALAVRGESFHCPNCTKPVVLRRGRIKIAHFAHKTERDCSWAKGETIHHIGAKRTLADGLRSRGLRVELEYPIPILEGDRRADVATWSPSGRLIAFELQHSSIDLDSLERRAFAYASAGILQCWIPLMRSQILAEATAAGDGTLVNEKFVPRLFEKWVHGFCGTGNGMWMFDPATLNFWLGKIQSVKSPVEPRVLIINGQFASAGGFERYSKQFRKLTLQGPYKAEDLRIAINTRRRFSTAGYNWPEATFATLIPPEWRT